MSTHLRCDRCQAGDDPHMRSLAVTAAPDNNTPWTIDLCGYCWSRLKIWLEEPAR